MAPGTLPGRETAEEAHSVLHDRMAEMKDRDRPDRAAGLYGRRTEAVPREAWTVRDALDVRQTEPAGLPRENRHQAVSGLRAGQTEEATGIVFPGSRTAREPGDPEHPDAQEAQILHLLLILHPRHPRTARENGTARTRIKRKTLRRPARHSAVRARTA